MEGVGAGPTHTTRPVRRDPRFIPNHTIDPATGFMENRGYLDAFDATKKQVFIEALRANDFRLLPTCQTLGISPHTVHHHRRTDKAFDAAVRQAVEDYAENLEWMSRAQAMEPRATLERIFQLRALRPERYARELKQNDNNITIKLDFQSIPNVVNRDAVIDVAMESGEVESANMQLEGPGQ